MTIELTKNEIENLISCICVSNDEFGYNKQLYDENCALREKLEAYLKKENEKNDIIMKVSEFVKWHFMECEDNFSGVRAKYVCDTNHETISDMMDALKEYLEE